MATIAPSGGEPGKRYVEDKGCLLVISVVNVLIKSRFQEGFRCNGDEYYVALNLCLIIIVQLKELLRKLNYDEHTYIQ